MFLVAYIVTKLTTLHYKLLYYHSA